MKLKLNKKKIRIFKCHSSEYFTNELTIVRERDFPREFVHFLSNWFSGLKNHYGYDINSL